MAYSMRLSKGGTTHKEQYRTRIDEIDRELFWCKWSVRITPHTMYAINSQKSIRGKRRREIQFLHRVIMERIMERKLLKGERVIHLDGDGLNNTRDNLQLF